MRSGYSIPKRRQANHFSGSAKLSLALLNQHLNRLQESHLRDEPRAARKAQHPCI